MSSSAKHAKFLFLLCEDLQTNLLSHLLSPSPPFLFHLIVFPSSYFLILYTFFFLPLLTQILFQGMALIKRVTIYSRIKINPGFDP